MKNIFIKLSVFVLALLGLNSCLFKDDIGDELGTGSIVGEGVLHSGQADSINYHKVISQKGFDFALEKLEGNGIIGQLLSAQYAMIGGKNGELPGPHAYQFQFSLQIDNYAGYMCAPQNFGGRLASTYYNSQDFNGGAMGSFMQVKNFTVPVLNHPQIDSIPEIKAVALLIYNYAAQQVVDIYGALPYADYKANKQSSPFTYNSGELIYKTIVNNVDTIVACFNHFDSKPKWYKDGVNALLAEYDRITGNKKISSWIRFANSLKLRMAMNVVKAEPELARKWAEEAVAAGVVDEASQQIRLAPIELGFVNPLLMISNTWNDTRLNASLETILKSYNHPMLEFLFSKNSDPIISDDDNKITPAESMIVGLRSGISMMSGQSYDVNFRTAYSGIRETIVEMPLFIIRLAEMDFLRAEGALRGWNMGGSAEQFYNRGIQEAFEGTNLKDFNEDYTEEIIFDKAVYPQALAGYMALEKAKDIVYVDPAYKAHNAQSLVAVGVKWNEGDNDETKLEKIMTQKYIAFFPYSFGAWNDLRRTGYPRIFPVLPEDTGDGSLSAGEIIRRIPFSASDEATKQDIATSGLKAIGGPDLQATRIWWDLPQSNF